MRPIWGALAAAGITQGVVLEPGAGRGSFITEAPDDVRVLGVELDPATAKVAQALAEPRHSIVQGDFAAVQLNSGAADGVVGNVPFGQYALFDAEHNPRRRLSIHDHFIAKSAAALRPGGIGIVVTSSYTLDKGDRAGRDAIGAHADFIGAVRLPAQAHQAEAGTKVVTDVVVLRGRVPGEPANHASGWDDPPGQITHWQGQPLDEPARISSYYTANPDLVLGQVQVRNGMFRGALTVEATEGHDLENALAGALDRVTAQLTPTEVATATPTMMAPMDLVRQDQADSLGPLGRIERTETGLFQRVGPDGWEPHRPPATQRDELAALIGVRDLAEDLVALESRSDVPDAVADETRQQLRTAWEQYTGRWGPINRVKINEETGQRTYPQMGGFRQDPGWPRVAALEIYDQTLNRAEPASIMTQRVIDTAEIPDSVTSPADALALSLGQLGRVEIDYIASLLGTQPDQTIGALGDLIYHDPTKGKDGWVTAEEYLSGNVREKHAAAALAAETDQRYARNVEALAGVIPRDVTAQELTGVLGAPWLPTDIVQDFARSLCPNPEHRSQITVAHSDVTGGWVVKAPSHVTARMKGDHEFGLATFDALAVLEAAANGRSPKVTIATDDGKVPDPTGTAQAIDLASDITERFDTWLHEDPERSRRALDIFNERHNSHVARSYTQAAEALSTDGLRNDFHLMPHQRQAVARMVYGGNTLLAHPVGAGKTAEMITGAMSLKRLGIVNRPCFVVPNHMLDQFASDVVGLYPSAQVLTITKNDFNKTGRETFAARVRSHDWDAVVITHNSFTRWPLSPERETTSIEAKLAKVDAEIAKLAESTDNPADESITKKLERRKISYESQLKEARAARENVRDDHTFHFDAAGIDYLVVDEAHTFKNAEIPSQVRDLRGVPTGKAAVPADDLESKLAWLRDTYETRPVATFATATPISNTAAELWVMGKYLRPDLLDEMGVGAFDAFRLTFCDTTSVMELDVSGSSFRRVERLARYKNLPELARMWGEFADVVSVDELDLPRPDLAGGQRNVVVVPRSPQLADFMTGELSQRADAVRSGAVEPEDDNNLWITTDARLASFDWETFCRSKERPVEPEEDAYSTLVAAADQIATIYHDNKDRTYTTAAGQPHPRPGAFQLVFSDLGTHKSGRDDTAYARLRHLLTARGVPSAQVAFIHEHDQGDKADEAKARFFSACRDGRVAVAVSSTPKMGMGTNVQNRLLALHHLDCPWRPSDIEQREGRIVRQGNQNPEVQIYAYATERSFSTAGWQTIERKAGFIGQIMRADPSGPRSLEPDDEEALAYGQIKALSTGDPGFLKLADLEDKLARLERLQRGHHQEQAALGRRQDGIQTEIGGTRTAISRLDDWAAKVAARPDSNDAFPLYVNGRQLQNRGDAARAIAANLTHQRPVYNMFSVGVGHDQLTAHWSPIDHGGRFAIDSADISVVVDDTSHNALVGALTRTINQLRAVPNRLENLQTRLTDELAQLERIDAALGAPFERADELRETRQQVNQLRQTLEERYVETEPGSLTTETVRAAALSHNSQDYDNPELHHAVKDGQPVRTVTVASLNSGNRYQVTVTHGLYHDGSFVAAEDPATHTVRPRRRQDIGQIISSTFGSNLDGFELRIVDHTSGKSEMVEPSAAQDAARHLSAARQHAQAPKANGRQSPQSPSPDPLRPPVHGHSHPEIER